MFAGSRSWRSALAVPLSAALLACGDRRPETTSSAAGLQVGVSYAVDVYRPGNGVVDSTDGQIHCGPAGRGADACHGVFAWTATATLLATPDTGYVLEQWAGDCTYTGPCVLTAGADKYVLALFAIEGQQGHGNFTSVKLHGPAYLDFLGNVPGHLNCNLSGCHGANLQGAGIAPNCFSCHVGAGWTNWQTNCSFCHGAKTAAAKAGYPVADHPAWSAPPDSVSQRLDGVAVPARSGAHQVHLSGVASSGAALSAPFKCETCHAVPTNLTHVNGSSARATVALSGAGQGLLPASLGTYDPQAGTCASYCHGGSASPAWSSTSIDCDSCHGSPPTTGHPPALASVGKCAVCHPDTVRIDGTIDVSPQGRHLNGKVDLAKDGACDGCHGFPPALGAHAKHDGLSAVGPNASSYGDLRTLQERVPGATPTSAPATYAFGCGNCHPRDSARHMDGLVEVELADASAPAGSLKSLASPTATFDGASGTCSGAYCHSSGQASPAFAITPAWTSGASLGCDGCHGDPPRYPSGGAGTATANSHLGLSAAGVETGHFPGRAGHRGEKHGQLTGQDEAPITCQACHAETVDPANTGPSGFYWLDTTGAYQLPGGDPSRLTTADYAALDCASCHTAGDPLAPSRAGKVLPLRHVNGARDVIFDPRTALSVANPSWLPPAPNAPAAPYWFTDAYGGPTVSFSLKDGTYDPATKSCSGVECHLTQKPVWGAAKGPGWCTSCHFVHTAN
jgi:predicted CxxxxCH...CXXCH cytochrome family protein